MTGRQLLNYLLCFALACGSSAASGCKSDDDTADSENDEMNDESRGEPDSGAEPTEHDAGPAPVADAGGGSGGSGGGDDGEWHSSRGQCDLNSGYPGDETCLVPPAEGEGIQLHIGPSSYEDADVAPWMVAAGAENSQCYFFKSPNADQVWFQSWELSGRPGTHHIINSALVTAHPDGFAVCVDQGLGNSPEVAGLMPGASRAYMPRAPVAPENAHLGAKMEPETPGQADMHYFNFTDQPILREFWLNLYTVDASIVEQEGNPIRGMGGLSWALNPIAPGTHETYSYDCPISDDGRIIRLIGHTHKHGIRETAWIRHADGEKLKVFEQFDYMEPQIFEYNSITENPDFADNLPGAYTGAIDVVAGDTLEWECEVNNDSQVALRYTNAVETGEMCNIWGETVGPLLNCIRY